ncbi:depupylase/deamidase Dop [Demetria terragena]|uniref:depupylase/deamidase Dop n=1 Tax=Demetria terragena TaxID=63959 RepID=UPI001B7F990E|nr:depupylase/deamidase Dop [Demetria terragena]
MTVRRVMGVETEYGISVPGSPQANPMVQSGRVVTSYAQDVGLPAARTGWDYEDETPLSDARGWEMARVDADASQLTDEEDPTLANVVLTNGARLYVDHAHPEYSSPEVMSPRDAVRWDRAGELVMREAVRLLSPQQPGVNLYKNNTDGKGASYGTHENYLMSRATPFADIAKNLIPFFVVRQVMCGSGRVGIGAESSRPGFQLAQRSDFFEVEMGLETTLKRPIINTRDEPHAVADRYRRLHVILGDANHCDVANLLKMGTTSLVLGMIEAGAITSDLTLSQPVSTLRDISHDPTLQTPVRLASGRSMTSIELLWAYYEMAAKWLERTYGGTMPDEDTAEVMTRWEQVLTGLESDPMSLHRELDWVAKLKLLRSYADRAGLEWTDPRLRAIDIQWSDVREDKGLFNRMLAGGQVERLVAEEDVLRAVTEPPEDTRAYFRGTCLARFPDRIAAASWDSIIFDVPGERSLQRVPMLEPERGTRAAVGEVLESATDVADLLSRLAVE